MTIPPHGGPPPGQPGRPGSPEPQPPGPYGPPPPGGHGGPPAYSPPPQQYGPPWGAPAGPGQPPYGPPPYGQPWGGQPPYGPQYGAPPSGPPPRRSYLRLSLGLAALVGLVVLAVVLARLLGDTVLDPGAVERDVAEQFEEREGVAVELDCPEGMTVERDAVHRCSGTTADGEDVTFEIRITDVVTASYTWEEV